MTLCAPWLEAGQAELCNAADPKLPRALLVASHLLYKATAMQFPGLCTDKVSPGSSSSGAVQYLDYPSGGSRPINVMSGCGCSCGDPSAGGCTAHGRIRLPGNPIADVIEVLIDGVAFTDYAIDRDTWLVRTDGGSWPCCQTPPWTVEYRYGLLPTPDLVLAAERLACELVAGWNGGDCALPERLTQLTYEGASMTTLDPFTFLDEGRFGILEVDMAVTQANPNRLQRNGVARTARDFLAQETRLR